MEFIHRPVLLEEAVAALDIKPDGIYVDGTAGGAGHSSEIAKRLDGGRLIALDRDPDAVETAKHFGIHADRAVNYHADCKGTEVLYEAVSKTVSAYRCAAPLSANWSKKISDDFKNRKK